MRALFLTILLLGLAQDRVLAGSAGEEAYGRADYGKSEEYYRGKALSAPDRPDIQYNWGNSLYQLGRYEDAAGAFGRAVEKDPGLARGWYNLGNSLFRQDRYRDAVEAFKQALELDPGDSDAKWNLELAERKRRQNPEKDKSRNEEKKKEEEKQEKPRDSKNTSKDGKEEQKSYDGQSENRDLDKKGDAKAGQQPTDAKGDGESREKQRERETRSRAQKELGLTDKQVEDVLKRFQAEEARLQGYFSRNPRRPGDRREDVLDSLPKEQRDEMKRFFRRAFPEPGDGEIDQDW